MNCELAVLCVRQTAVHCAQTCGCGRFETEMSRSTAALNQSSLLRAKDMGKRRAGQDESSWTVVSLNAGPRAGPRQQNGAERMRCPGCATGMRSRMQRNGEVSDDTTADGGQSPPWTGHECQWKIRWEDTLNSDSREGAGFDQSVWKILKGWDGPQPDSQRVNRCGGGQDTGNASRMSPDSRPFDASCGVCLQEKEQMRRETLLRGRNQDGNRRRWAI